MRRHGISLSCVTVNGTSKQFALWFNAESHLDFIIAFHGNSSLESRGSVRGIVLSLHDCPGTINML